MDSLLDFFSRLISSFGAFGSWFFNTEIVAGLKPYMIFCLGGLIIILGLHILKLVNPL